MHTVACVDVGGTTIKAGVLDGNRLVDVREEATPPAGPGAAAAVLEAVVRIVDDLSGSHRPVGVGLVVPGVVDAAAGIATWSENLGWRDVPFRALLEDRIGLPVGFGHDVRAGGLAEARLGAAAGHRDVLFLPVGTGIAAGIVLDGELYDRPRPVGEIGHVDVGFDEPCVCGLRGCLEAVASAAAIARRYALHTGRSVSAAEVADRVAGGEPAAGEVWNDAVVALGRAIAWCAAMLAPEVVVVGGGLARAGDLLFEPLRAEVARGVTFHHLPAVVPAALGGLSGCVGAGLLARAVLESRTGAS